MIRAIFYKEFLKLRLIWGLALIVHIGMIVYLLLSLRSTLLASGVVETWATMIGRDVLMINPLMYLPLITGVGVALCQWLPEMQVKRIRLTLHLPLPYTSSIGAMLFSSLLGLTILFTLDAAVLALVEQIWLPRELVGRTLLTCLPWFLGGLIGYNVVSWCLLEPQWSIRCCNLLIGASLVALCFLTSQPACYLIMWRWLILVLVLTLCFPFYSVYRFKLGKQ
jgi:hypothetical protein